MVEILLTSVKSTHYIYVATEKGIIQFKDFPINQNSPRPLINHVSTENNSFIFNEEITLPFRLNDFQIKFTTINHKMNGDINYRYKFNKNETWKKTKERNLNLVDVGSGIYIFEVQSQNEDNIWSESTYIQFEIKPPWWGSRWLQMGLCLLIGITLFLYYKLRINRIKTNYKLKEELRKLEKSALQAQMNPHFIFNCLNSIQAFIMDNEKEQAMEYLGSFAQLIRSNLNASIESQISLSEEVRILENYLKLEQLRLEHRFEYSINIESAIDREALQLPPMLIQPFVENAVIHGMKNIISHGIIGLTFTLKNDQLHVTVKDNGGKLHKPKSNEHKSVGIDITKKRLAHINQTSRSQVNVDIQHTNEGTTVNLSISL